MTLIKYITIHPRINIGLQYIINTSEYILNLQLHQHSLLTRKVFSRHNLTTQVFFSVSSGSLSSSCRLHLEVLFIFKSSFIIGSGSSLNLDHRHWIWIIITESGSSLDIITGSRSSLDLDHYLIWIITAKSSSLDLDPHSIWIITTGAIS